MVKCLTGIRNILEHTGSLFHNFEDMEYLFKRKDVCTEKRKRGGYFFGGFSLEESPRRYKIGCLFAEWESCKKKKE